MRRFLPPIPLAPDAAEPPIFAHRFDHLPALLTFPPIPVTAPVSNDLTALQDHHHAVPGNRRQALHRRHHVVRPSLATHRLPPHTTETTILGHGDHLLASLAAGAALVADTAVGDHFPAG